MIELANVSYPQAKQRIDKGALAAVEILSVSPINSSSSRCETEGTRRSVPYQERRMSQRWVR